MRMLIPSVDLSGGLVVKRVRGLRGSELVRLRPDEVLDLVSSYPMIHIVDLDGAEIGRPVNFEIIRKIAREVNGRCQVGGGIRSLRDAEAALKFCRRVVLGTLAVEDPRSLTEFVDELGSDAVAVSLDVLDGVVMSRGWRKAVGPLNDVLTRIPRVGALIYTAINVEGTGTGPRLPEVDPMRRVAEETHYAGGVSSCDDVRAVWDSGFDGVIVGYALYVRRIRCL